MLTMSTVLNARMVHVTSSDCWQDVKVVINCRLLSRKWSYSVNGAPYYLWDVIVYSRNAC